MLNLESTLWDLVERRATASPDAVMLLDDGGQQLTFEGFRRRAEEVAAGLASLGAGAGTAVAWQLPTAVESVVVIAALARLGAVQVPIIPLLRRREVSFITRQAGVRLYLGPKRWRTFDYTELAEEVGAENGFDPVLLDHDGGRFVLPTGDPGRLPPAPGVEAGGNGPVRWIYYTSGTTADPKGVKHTDASVLAASNGQCLVLGVQSDDVLVVPIPMAHIGGLMLLGTLLRSGCRALMVDAFDPVATPAVAARHGATALWAAGPMYRAYLDAQYASEAPLYPELRVCCNGGSAVPVELHLEVKKALGGIGISSSWGLTECPADTFPLLSATDHQLAATVGPPVPGVELRVVGADGPCATGEEGELRLRGPQLFSGYVDSSLDVDAFDEDGFLRTGDLGTVDADGYVRITGRIKDIIIRNAENISAREVEEVLILHPKIADATVLGIPDPRTGERCCALVQLARDATSLTLPEVLAHCKEVGLATHKIPERLEVLPVIPRNDLGKVQKHVLRQQILAGS
jgi:acyl-CoA synthetase (AMP-forming)/AMP-acid ligase II